MERDGGNKGQELAPNMELAELDECGVFFSPCWPQQMHIHTVVILVFRQDARRFRQWD